MIKGTIFYNQSNILIICYNYRISYSQRQKVNKNKKPNRFDNLLTTRKQNLVKYVRCTGIHILYTGNMANTQNRDKTVFFECK